MRANEGDEEPAVVRHLQARGVKSEEATQRLHSHGDVFGLNTVCRKKPLEASNKWSRLFVQMQAVSALGKWSTFATFSREHQAITMKKSDSTQCSRN